MKKVLFFLSIIASVGLLISFAVLLLGASTYLLGIQLIMCSIVGFCTFFSLYIIRRGDSKYFKIFLGVGLLLFSLFCLGIYRNDFLHLLWPYLISGISFLLVSAIYYSVKRSNKILSFLSLLSLISTGISLVAILIFQVTDPFYYKIALITLSITSGIIFLSTLFSPTTKEN